MITFQDVCLMTVLLVWTLLHLVFQWADRRDKKDRGPASRETDRTSGQAHGVVTSPKAVNPRPTKDSSVSPINVDYVGSHGKVGQAILYGESHESYERRAELTSSEADTLSLSNVSELHSAATASENSHRVSNIHQVTTNDLPSARHTAQVTAYDHSETGVYGNAVEDLQRSESGLTGDTGADMEARRRRRLLEKASDVSPVEASNWRSKVYQKENTNTSNASSFPHKETPWASYRSKETLSPIDNHTQEAHPPGDSRRRRSEDSNCGDLSERLARRRAKRLEEKRGSLSNDWSVNSQHDVVRQWSRDSSVRSTDSFDVGDNDARLSDHWCKQHDQDVSSGRRGSRNTCDSLVFTGSTDNHEEVQDKLHKPRLRGTDSEGSNKGESKAASSEAGSRKWSSKDSNFYSAESTSSLRSYDDASSGNAAQLYRNSLGQESTEREPVGHSRSRRKTPYQNWSEDSAFSEMKETHEDTLNTNNNNDNSEIIRFQDISKYPSLKPGNEDFKNEAGEVGGSALGILGSCVVSSSLSPVNAPQVAGGFSGMESSEFSSREIEASKPEVLSLSKPNSALLATSREDGSGRVEELNCWGGSFEIPSQNTVTSQTECQEPVQKHAERAASANSARETNEAALSTPDRGDVSNENSSSPQPPESKAARKRRTRKDKSALRKSVLNMADVPAEYEGNTQVQHDVGQSEERPRRRQEGSFVSQHASFWENTAPNIQNATPAKQRANIPARYTGDKEKLTATRQKFMQNATATKETSSTPGPKPKIETHDDVAPIKIARSSTDFNQLLQKFSGSESNSEKSDAEIGSAAASGVPKRRSLVRRQEAKEVITSSEESDTRRTPDRTQSLKLPSRHEDLKSVGQSENNSILRSEAMNIVEKSPSFRSEFISRKFAGKSMESSHREKETSPLRTVESYTTGVHHALAKEDHGIPANLNVQQNHPAHSKSLSLPVEPSEVQGQRQRLSAIGDKHNDLKSTSSFQNTALVHTEGNLIKQSDVSTTSATTVLMDKVKSQGNSSLDLMSKSNESASSKKVASGHAYSTSSSESKPEKQTATVHTTKQADSSITTAAKVSVDKEKSPNTSLDFDSKHKESVSGDKPAPLDVAAQSNSNIKPGIRAAEVHITKQADTSVTTAANVSMDTAKNPDTKLDLVSKHKDSVSGDKAGSPRVSSQISSDSKTDTRAAEGHVTKQVDTSITLATMVSVVEAKSLNANLDLASKHQESQSSDMSALSHTDSQSSSQSKRDIHVAEVRVSKQADTSLATKVPLDKAKSPNTNMNAISKHNEPAASTMLPSPHFTSEKTQENKDGLLSAAGNITKHGNASSVTAKEKVPMDKVTSQNTDLDLISNNNELVTSDNSVSGHVASASSSDSKHKTAATVNTNKSAASAATTTATTLMEKTKRSITNLDHGSATSDTSSQPVTSSSSPERKPDLPPSTGVLIASSMATDASQHHETPVAKPRSSVEREPKPQANITNTSVTSAQSADFTSPSSNSSALTSSVSSSVLHSSSVSSDMTPNAGEVRRASSFKEATVSRTESMERRKGILKRNTSLNKHDTPEAGGSSSFPVLDPQLAKILMQRKQMLGDGDAIDEAEEKKDEVHELARRARPLSAAEEIEETLRYSLQKAAQRGVNPDDEAEGLKRISVADRVYSMQSKIEEEKYAALTPKSRSGLSTPRSRPRSGFITPTSQKSFDETNQQQQQLQSQPPSMTTSVTTAAPTAAAVPAGDGAATQPEEQPGRSSTAVSGPQLMEKLSELASATERYQEKRHRFQHRARSDWRYQTQPVTFEEIQAADRMESVSAFRALVRKQTSINAFEQINAETSRVTKQLLSQVGKTMEFPQHLTPPPRHTRRGRMLRHRTLPVTAEELNAVPEHQMLVTNPDWLKLDQDEIYDSKADSGILSGSDAESLNHADSLRSLTAEMDASDADPSRMSVTDKTSMFRVLEERTKAERDKEKSASGAKRYINRKKRERSQTMPITEEEVKSASEMGNAGGGIISGNKTEPVSAPPQPEVVNRSRSSSISDDAGKEAERDDDELAKLSLTEKVRLFSQPREPEKQAAKTEAPVVKRRNRKVASRFNTQPVTNEEVEKAAAYTRISPLAMSLVKPPDTEILKGLPLKDQRELMAQHAEMFLSQNSFRSRSGSSTSQSQPSSRRPSVNLEDDETKKADKEDCSEKGDKRGILKDKSASAKDLHDTKSILKTEPSKAKSESEVHSILKMEVKHIVETTPGISEPRGILKKTRSEDMSGLEGGDDIKGILKHIDSEEEECQGKPRSRSNSQPLGILKMEGFSQASEHSTEIKSILKAPSQENMHDSQMIKSAMRRGSMESDISVTTPTSSLKSALRSRNRSSLETDDIQTPGANVKIVSQDGDLNSNNSQRHVGLSIQSSDVTIDHFSSSTCTKISSATSSTTIKSSSSVDSRTFASTSSSSSVTTCTASASSLQVPEASEEKSGQSGSDDGESSSGEILDGTPRRTKLKRKSRFSDKSAQAERYKTQPPELTDSASSASTPADAPARRKYKYEGRHRTQPITPDEMREAEATTPASDLIRTPGGSIADRLNQLKTSGEEEWKKRVGRKEEILATPEVIKLREKPGLSDHRPTSIADRLNELETSKTTWKERVEESDAKQFTVAARLAQGSTDSPLVNKLKNLPRKDESGSRGNTPLSSPVTPTKDFIAKIPLPKDIVQDTTVDVEGLKAAASSNKKIEEDDEKREPVTVEVPDMGEEVENFFAVKSIEEIKDRVEMHEDDFNNLFIEAEMILSSFQKASPKRKTKSSSRNPLKTMSTKLEIRQEYTEVFHGTAEKELKRVKKEGLAKEAGFAQAALAGLASTENFKQVELRRTDSGSSVHGQAHDPFKEPMLLHVKGRRSVQMRLVEPHTRSVNEGDCYVLVTSDKIIYWEGRFANVIEKAKANEVASYILQKKDLGCKKAAEVLSVHQLKGHLGSGKQFWASLEGEKHVQECGPDEEDELYENSIVKCNMVYRLEGNALLPYQEYWGAIPRHEMLKKNEVIVFDFGTEFYVWQGKAVSMEQRRLGMKLSKQLYEKGYNYTESPLNPMSPLRSEDSGGLPLSSPTRPSWAIFGKVNQNMETILFREKFADWPDSSRLIGYRGHAASDILNRDLLELKPFDAKKMIPVNTAPVSLKLEGANVGRGVKWSEDMQGFVKEQDIITLDVIVWYVLEFEHYKLPALSHGQFHDGDTYVVRWQYMIANANMRSLKGSAARNSLTGRERCAYFFWQGNESTINEKGASALMTVELDEERGPQIRVLQGKEPPCFLNLFDGKMIVHIGKREEPSTNSQGSWRLYCLRGDYENEVYLLEIPVSVEHLRSRSSMVLLNVKTGKVYVWHGAKSPKHVRELSLKAVNKLKEITPLEVRLHDNATITEVIEVEEGKENREIWSALGHQDRAVYNSLLQDPKPYSHTIRLFHMSSVSLIFEVQEQLNPARVHDLTTPFPFLQSDLYKATQPALFLIDNEFEVYLWQGWWPIGSEDTENVHTGSAIARFNLDRRLAMETTLHYCKEKNPRSPPTAYLVCAGVEPVRFTSLFPFWEEDSVVKEIAAEEGKTAGYTEKVSEILLRLTQTRYTLAELQVKPLPEGVDPLRLETYLQDADFEEILEMSRDDFYSHPHWKQIEMKKHVGLF